jgi:hypothetical protein
LVGGEPAFSFVNDNGDESGGSFEVWFVHDGFLYEVIASELPETTLTDILKTWKLR